MIAVQTLNLYKYYDTGETNTINENPYRSLYRFDGKNKIDGK